MLKEEIKNKNELEFNLKLSQKENLKLKNLYKSVTKEIIEKNITNEKLIKQQNSLQRVLAENKIKPNGKIKEIIKEINKSIAEVKITKLEIEKSFQKTEVTIEQAIKHICS